MPGREMDVPGSRLLLRPAVGSAAVFPGMAVCQVRGTPMIGGWRLSSVRIQVLGGAAGGSWPGSAGRAGRRQDRASS